jgi:hypothetical protein
MEFLAAGPKVFGVQNGNDAENECRILKAVGGMLTTKGAEYTKKGDRVCRKERKEKDLWSFWRQPRKLAGCKTRIG